MLAFLLTAGTAFQLVRALEEVRGGLCRHQLNVFRGAGMRREIQKNIAWDNLKLAALFTNGYQFAVQWNVITLCILAPNRNLKEMKAIRFPAQGVDVEPIPPTRSARRSLSFSSTAA